MPQVQRGDAMWNCEVFKVDILFTPNALDHQFLNCFQLQSYFYCDSQNQHKQYIFVRFVIAFATAVIHNIISAALARSPTKRHVFLSSTKGKRKHSYGIYMTFLLYETFPEGMRFKRFFLHLFALFFKIFLTAIRHVSPVWTEHLAHYLGAQVMENQTETDVATDLPQISCCIQGSLGCTTKPTQTFLSDWKPTWS